MFTPWKKSYNQPRQHIKKQKYYFANKGHLIKSIVYTVVMYGCESWKRKLSTEELMIITCGVEEDS